MSTRVQVPGLAAFTALAWFRYSDLAPFDSLIWPHLTENHIPWTLLRAQSPQGRTGWTGEPRWSYSSRSDASTNMVVERFEGLPRSLGFIGGWCGRLCSAPFR